MWADPKPDGSPPNNWVMAFDPRVPAWTFDEASGQYYLNQFLSSQPDLNWWNDDVRDAFDDILRFWFDRGVAGFRIDVCHSIIKDRDLRDNPLATKDDHWWVQMSGQRSVYNACRPEVHDVLRRWRKLADGYDPHRVLIGETYVLDPTQLGVVLRRRRRAQPRVQLHAAALEARRAPTLRTSIEEAEQYLPANAWPVWTGGNHDNHRFPSRWCGDDPAKTRAAMVMLMGLRGTPFLYYGDEIGMPDTEIPDDRVLDPVGVFHGARIGRDPERTPMPWTGEPGAGYTEPGVEPWLPYGDVAACNVADQRHDPDSMLSLTRDLIGLRDAMPELRRGSYATLPSSDDRVWAWQRGERTVVAMNCSDERRRRSRRGHRRDPHLDDPRARRRASRRLAAPRAVGSRDRLARRALAQSAARRSTASSPRGPVRPGVNGPGRRCSVCDADLRRARRRSTACRRPSSARSAATAERVERAG